MMDGFFMVISFAALLALEEGTAMKYSSPHFREIPGFILRKSVLIFWQLLVILTIMMLVKKFGPNALKDHEASIMIVLAWTTGYYLSYLRNQSVWVFVTVASFSLFVFQKAGQESVVEVIRWAYIIAFSTAFVWFLIAGMKRQLLYANLPQAVKGLPIDLLLISVLALILNLVFSLDVPLGS